MLSAIGMFFCGARREPEAPLLPVHYITSRTVYLENPVDIRISIDGNQIEFRGKTYTREEIFDETTSMPLNQKIKITALSVLYLASYVGISLASYKQAQKCDEGDTCYWDIGVFSPVFGLCSLLVYGDHKYTKYLLWNKERQFLQGVYPQVMSRAYETVSEIESNP